MPPGGTPYLERSMMAECCTHCRLNDIGQPPDNVEWPDEFMLPRWLTANAATWVTKDGQVIPITQLGDRHLYNINRMLGRIQDQADEVDDEGQLSGVGPPMELFDRKFSAIQAEIGRRGW